jgi:hypothetical protein
MSSIPDPVPQPLNSLSAAPSYTLFDSASVALATFFGTPVAGATLMAVNDKRTGRAGRGVATVLVVLLVTALVIFLGWNIPQGFSSVIAVVLIIAMQRIAARMQGASVSDHQQRGGRLASKWAAFGVGMAYLTAIFAVVFVAVFIPTYKIDHGPKVVIGAKDEVFYTGAATQADAKALGETLKASGYFADNGVTVLLDKQANGAIVSFVVKEGIWDKPDMIASFDEMGREVAPPLGGFPIQVRLINKNREIKNETTVGKLSAGNDHVYYLGTATAAQAQALADALKSAGFFEGKGADVFVSRQSDGTTLSFVVGDGAWDDAGLVTSFEKIARQAAPSIGGLPLHLHLENTGLEVKKDEALQ